MARQHPVHEAVAALTRTQRQRISIANTGVSYRVEAPCLLQQLADELGVGQEHPGGRSIASSRLLITPDAWDLWTEIQTSVHTWARELHLDRTPYLTPAAAEPGRPVDPDRQRHDIPPVGRLLRLVAATATSRALDNIADAIHRSSSKWRAAIEAMLHDVQEQRGIRGATCPACEATHVVERRTAPPDPGTYRVPAIVLTTRDVAGETLRWLTCQACGWTRGLEDEQLLHRLEASA